MKKVKEDSDKKYTTNKHDLKYQEMVNFLKRDQKIGEFFEIMQKAFRISWIFYIICIVSFVIGMIIAWTSVFEGYSAIITIIVVAITIAFGIIGFSYSKKGRNIKRNKVIPFLMHLDWKTLYRKTKDLYFENVVWEIEDFKLNSLFYRANSDKNYIIFKYKETELVFQINSFVERRTVHVGDKSYTKYQTHVDKWLMVRSEDLKFQDQIVLQKNKMFSKGDFELESIEFNKKFEIFSQNQLLTLKAFSPSVIDKYTNIEISKEFVDVVLDNRGVTSHLYKFLRGAYYSCELGNFRIASNWNGFITELINKMANDLDKFVESLLYVEPLL